MTVLAKSKYFYGLYLLVLVVLVCLLTEYVSQRIHRSKGVEVPFLFGTIRSNQKSFGRDDFTVLDPHLGYAHGETERGVRALKSKYTWMRGFAIYSKKPLDQLDRPIILALGGSTTDPIQYGHSWPEELAKILEEKGIPATVINGGIGGYSTNQELIKLIRDGVEFGPDLVISYSGVNDRGQYGELPNPMVHKYQRKVFSEIIVRKLSPLFPSTILLLQNFLGHDKRTAVGYTLGMDTSRSIGKWYERNLSLMEAVARASDAKFFAVLQPNAYVGDYEWSAEYERQTRKTAKYINSVRELYAEISDLPKRVDYVYDFTKIFSGIKDVYTSDGVHVTIMGNKIIAMQMFQLLTSNVRMGKR